MNRMNNQPGLPPVGVPMLEQVIQQRQQQKMQAVQGRAQMAMAMFQGLLPMESQTPKLQRCRELVNLAFSTAEYFNTRAIEPLKEDEPTIVKDE